MNLRRLRAYAPASRLVAVVKANAYGHGQEFAVSALKAMPDGPDRLAVATLDELVALQALGPGIGLLHLQGPRTADELRYLLESGADFVVHADYQLALLKSQLRDHPRRRCRVWLKLDTGMHRLGMTETEAWEAVTWLRAAPQLEEVVLMSHFATADGSDPDALRLAETQQQRFDALLARAQGPGAPLRASLAASAAILRRPAAHHDYVRPGVSLYGGSPFDDVTGPELQLQPVMSLQARLMAIKDVPAGDSIGYGATYLCPRPMRIGVVSIGYGDGYPRAAASGTPVSVMLADGPAATVTVGRVSMDMITIDLTDIDAAQPGDVVELWGRHVGVDQVAHHAGTIAYELMCRVTPRVTRIPG